MPFIPALNSYDYSGFGVLVENVLWIYSFQKKISYIFMIVFPLQIRLQLETLLAEKARLAHENSVYARENRFLREVVEYHQLTMQDVVYLDESNEEVTEVNPLNLPPVPSMPLDSFPSATSLSLPPEVNLGMSSELTRGISSSKYGKDAKSSEVTRKDAKWHEILLLRCWCTAFLCFYDLLFICCSFYISWVTSWVTFPWCNFVPYIM